jgi:hypothetical protein
VGQHRERKRGKEARVPNELRLHRPVYTRWVEEPSSGHTVLVTTKALDCGEPLKVYYAVAEPDQQKAIAIVRDSLGITSDEVIEAVGPLSAEQLIALSLAPGHFEQL